MAKGYGETLVGLIVEELKSRACDPWDDELWPAANVVLMQIAEELRRDKKSWQAEAWAKWSKARRYRQQCDTKATTGRAKDG